MESEHDNGLFKTYKGFLMDGYKKFNLINTVETKNSISKITTQDTYDTNTPALDAS